MIRSIPALLSIGVRGGLTAKTPLAMHEQILQNEYNHLKDGTTDESGGARG
ncbi:MAG TPA: hypothetical protein VH540_10855 [Ktedonobacterales bacterium]